MDIPNTETPEGSSCNIYGTVREYKGGPAIGSANISVATMQINNLDDNDTVIRAVDDIITDIDADGILSTVVTGAENAMLDDTLNKELHVATIRITGTSADAQVVDIIQSVVITVTQNPNETS